MWMLAFFFAWLLSFPLHGPVLFALAADRGLDFERLGLLFTLAHAGGLFFCGVLFKKEEHWKGLMIKGAALTLAISLITLSIENVFMPFVLILLGIVSSFFVIGWSVPYTRGIKTGRLTFMASVIILANLFYILFAFLAIFISPDILLILTYLPLLFSLKTTITCSDRPPVKATLPANVKTSHKILPLLCILVFCLYINGGIMYDIVIPSYIDFLSRHTVILPYVGGLFFMWFLGRRITTALPLYLSAGLMGLGFIAFAFLNTSFISFFTGGLLILFSLALLDVFLWTILGHVAERYRTPFKIFGWGLSLNVFALFTGSLLVQNWLNHMPNKYFTASFLASGLIFLVVILIPSFIQKMEDDLHKKLNRASPLNMDFLKSLPGMPNLDSLTHREQEILILILNGDANKKIAEKLFISENTVKAHQKRINQKLGTSGKHDLLALTIKALH